MSALRSLDRVAAIYEVPHDDIVGELLIPAMRAADAVSIMVGFFSSQSFAHLAPGLASLLERRGDPLRLLLSPVLSDADRDAIARAVRDPAEVVSAAATKLFTDARASESAIAAHVVDCLAYLLADGRLDMRFVVMTRGIFHPKVWLFQGDDDVMAVHGSSNTTEAGLLYNGETVAVERPWVDGPSATTRVDRFVRMFREYWGNERDYAIAVDPPAGLLVAGSRRPTTDDFWAAWRDDARKGLATPLPPGVHEPVADGRLAIPPDIEWQTGAFAHQGTAVRAWESNGRLGILSIATGGGKTVCAFIGATRLQDESTDPLLVVVLAPTLPLIDQWKAESRRFGVSAYVLSEMPAATRVSTLHGVVSALRQGVTRTEVVICSNALFVGDDALRGFLGSIERVRLLLVADEVHNLGTPAFLRDPPTAFESRLGLSATPIRQYDTAGTAELQAFFGPTVFEFDIGEAIAAGCLTPYEYFLHEVVLNDLEMELWEELTAKLTRLGFGRDDDGQSGLDSAVQRVLEKRRAILEHADAKLALLERLLVATPPADVRRTLIYTSAKRDPLGRGRQITRVNRLLNELGIISHQLTYDETGGRRARALLSDFAEGTYQALTCMKVLDEGVDVPATTTAFLLASSTVTREWVQRRGRVLRTAPGKTIAKLHDFFVVSPDPHSAAGRSILRGELARADEFCRLARNAWDSGGPRAVTGTYE